MTPGQEIKEAKAILRKELDRDHDERDTLHTLCTVAVNGLYYRQKEIDRLKAIIRDALNIVAEAANGNYQPNRAQYWIEQASNS